MRNRISSILAALSLGAAATLTGCAGEGGTGGASTAPPPSQSRTADLQVSIRADGASESAHYHLLCSGASALGLGDHPRAGEACQLLDANPQLLSPPAGGGNRACTMQYGGPATADVSGRLEGRAVARSFNLANGCGIADWNAALALLVQQPTGQLQ